MPNGVTLPRIVRRLNRCQRMSEKLRRQVAWEAARLMYDREETEYFPRQAQGGPAALRGASSNPAICPAIAKSATKSRLWARLHEGERRTENLRDMRLEALRLMRRLAAFRPRLIGSTLTGHVRRGSDIDLHVFSDSIEAVAAVLDEEGLSYEVERKRVRKHGEERVFVHIHIADRFPFELTIYAGDMAHFVFRSSITGKAIERASIAELEQLLAREYPGVALDQSVLEAESRVDRFQIYEMLLLPLENVKENPDYHAEGDAFYHSLQVFELARRRAPYDEEFLLAALLHDVGKAIDPQDHVAAGLEALAGPHHAATAWLIAHHMEGQKLLDGTLGVRARHRLEASEDFDELRLLARCDRDGRVPGGPAARSGRSDRLPPRIGPHVRRMN